MNMNNLKMAGAFGLMATLAACGATGDRKTIFVATHTYGVSIGGDATGSGADFTLGFKGASFAIIPVTAYDENGTEVAIGAKGTPDGPVKDSYSVIGQFTGKSGSDGVGLGKYFATGDASRNIAFGVSTRMYAAAANKANCKSMMQLNQERDLTMAALTIESNKAKLQKDLESLKQAPVPENDESKRQIQALTQKLEASSQAIKSLEGKIAELEARKRQEALTAGGRDWEKYRGQGANLIFAQYDYLALAAFDISPMQQEIRLTLGYRDRDIAVVPVMGRNAQGGLVPIEFWDQRGGRDSFSVLGQFNTKTITNSGVSNDLASYFSTGAAADVLSTGFQTLLCTETSDAKQKIDGGSSGKSGAAAEKPPSADPKPAEVK